MNPNVWIAGAVAAMLAVGALVFGNFRLPFGGWLIAGLVVASVALVGGEVLIKRLALQDRSARMVRFAVAILALIIPAATILSNFGLVVSWLGQLVATPEMIALVVLGAIIAYGAFKDAWSGSGASAITIWRVAFVVFIGYVGYRLLVGPTIAAMTWDAITRTARTTVMQWLSGAPAGAGWWESFTVFFTDINTFFLVAGIAVLAFAFYTDLKKKG